ncbi:helix-turn-helix transcriptional regulator [Flavicella sp.]|uniref:helix-turn-helix domain-containing protein n=1 Tax=Flavicella sp. TaxID=2957742 RepID=UPI003015A80A
MLNNTSFSNRLKKVMDFYQISASSFAETIEVPRSSISHILSGRNKPSLDFVLKTIDTYQEVDLYWLLKGIGNFPKSSPLSQVTKQISVKKTSEQTTKDQHEIKEDLFEKTKKPKNSNKTPIEKVLIFYTDGTFKEYNNQDNQ